MILTKDLEMEKYFNIWKNIKKRYLLPLIILPRP